MKLLQARGALLLLFDIAGPARPEHDEWHTHEHMPERLAIPGFRRGSRWTRGVDGPRYCVVYEVDDPQVLDSPAYRARLDDPSPWTTRMMASYIGMRRTLCEVKGGGGEGVGRAGLVVTCSAAPGRAAELPDWLLRTALPALSGRRGLVSWRCLENAVAAAMTREQSIRGRDGAVPLALWITGYDPAALASVAQAELGTERMERHGAQDVEHALFELACCFAARGG